MKTQNSFFIISVLFGISAFGQHTEFGLQLNSGMSRYIGEDANKKTFINYNTKTEDGYTNSALGNNFEWVYGLSANVIRTTKSNIRFGMDIGYEHLGSSVQINSVNGVSVTGKTTVDARFFTFFPSIGYQFPIASYKLFMDAGLVWGACQGMTQKGQAKSTTRTYTVRRDKKYIDRDFRRRIQIGIQKQKLGAYIGYSRGIMNYYDGWFGGSPEAYSEIVHLGLRYKL